MITGFYDLLDAFKGPGCAICRLLQSDLHRYFDSLLYEYVTERDVQESFRGARGLCSDHGWQIVHYSGNALGITILYDVALDEVLSIAARTPVSDSPFQRLLSTAPGQPLADKLGPTAPCPACHHLEAAERRRIELLSLHVGDEKLMQSFAGSEGLCLPHFRALVGQLPSADLAQRVAATQITIWKRLKTELETFIHKYNFEYRGEVIGQEGDSRLRAISSLSGLPGIFGMRRSK